MSQAEFTRQLKSHIQGTAWFDHYKDGACWYKCQDGFMFPVPVPGDIGSATLLDKDKGSIFMRYIRKHMEQLEQARNAQKES